MLSVIVMQPSAIRHTHKTFLCARPHAQTLWRSPCTWKLPRNSTPRYGYRRGRASGWIKI